MYLIKDSEKIQTDMYLVIIIFIVVVGSVIFRGKELEEKIEKQQMRINMLNKFNEQYNLLVETSRKKQHEFNNHINTLRGMSVVSDEQYKENQRMYIDTLSKKNRTIKILNYVEQPVLAGFLYKKVEEIMEKGINITIDLSVPANELCIDVIDCIEIIGILLDNAVEALQNNEEINDIILQLLVLNERINISVKNTSRFYDNDEISEFFIKDYSTKGEGRGLGLSKIKDLQRKYGFDIFVEMQEIHNKEYSQLFFVNILLDQGTLVLRTVRNLHLKNE